MPPVKWPQRLVIGVFFLAALAGVVSAARLFVQDMRFIQVQTEVSFWGRSDYHPPVKTVRRVDLVLERLLQSAPDNPSYLALRATSLAWQAYWARDAGQERQLAREALAYQRAAVASRPAHIQSRALMVQYERSLQELEN